MRHIVGVADYKVASNPADMIVTHALGSCLGIAAYDPVNKVGGLFHVMLPAARVNPDKARNNPYMFVDSGLPLFFRELYARGAEKKNIVVKIAGGAALRNENDFFAIGKRNYITASKLFLKNGIMVQGEDVGGGNCRTMYMELKTGRVWIASGGREKDL